MLIDLSMLVNDNSVVFPGDARPMFESTGAFAEHDVVDSVINVNIHLGTHIDAPAHMVKGGKMLDAFDLNRFKLKAICIDARGSDMLSEKLLEDMAVEQGIAVLLYTGAGERNTDQSYATNYPKISQALADKLVKVGVSMVGIDMISFDHDEPFPIHKTLLKNDILLIENLANLSAVVDKTFLLNAFPVKFHLEAAPARVVAEL